MCNDLPKIPANDDGTWRRLEAVPFVSRFVQADDVDEGRNRYLIDKELKHKIPDWKEVFMCILLKEWSLYNTEGIHIPDEVKEKTNDYRNENDIVGQWISASCDEAPNLVSTDGVTETAPTDINTLHTEFKDWVEEQEIAKYIVPDKKKFKTALLKWQEKSGYGLKIGKNAGDKKVNGTPNDPKFNLVLK